jgi:enamine deaminase RidA (YjgF/YER057c/UK114 family)
LRPDRGARLVRDFESTVGYSRAVSSVPVGPVVPATDTCGPTRIAAQTREALRRIDIALHEAGATLSDVVRTRIYVTDISRWREVGAVHAEVFGDIRSRGHHGRGGRADRSGPAGGG